MFGSWGIPVEMLRCASLAQQKCLLTWLARLPREAETTLKRLNEVRERLSTDQLSFSNNFVCRADESIFVTATSLSFPVIPATISI
jgi:hypothetical protein